MRPRKLVTILFALNGLRIARAAVVIGAVLAVARGRSHPTEAAMVPADTTPMLVPTIDPPSVYTPPQDPLLEARTVDGTLEGVKMYGEIGWAQQSAFGHTSLVHTTDGGATWSAEGPRIATEEMCGFASRNGNEAWIVTCQTGTDSHDIVSSTHDGGSTWTHQELASDLVDAAAFEFQEGDRVSLVLFPHSYAEGSRDARSILYRSSDGGRTWAETSRPGGGNVRFSDASHAFVRGDDEGHDDTLRWSTDGGKTFAIHPALRACAVSTDPVFAKARGVLVAACPAGVFAFRTTDAGVTWKPGARIEREDATGFDFSDPDHGILTDETSTLVTIDGGITWTSGDITRARDATFMPGTHHVFATDEGSNCERLLMSDDGKGWRTVATLPVYGTVDFVFSGSSDMLAVVRGSEGSLVYRSRDAGKSFAVMDRP